MRRKIGTNSGFTMVELIIVLALLAVTIGAVFTFFAFARESFNRTDVQTRLAQELNAVSMRIAADIRSAARPNAATYAVVVPEASETLAEGQSIWIYRYDPDNEQFMRICYRLNPSDKTILQRGIATCAVDTPPPDKNPIFAEITVWENIMDGVAYLDESADPVKIFEDETSPATNERRKIRVDLRVNDAAKPLPEPLSASFAATSRSEGVPE